MSNPNDELKTYLKSLKWQDLKREASTKYGIKLSAEYNSDDIISLIMAKASGNTSFVTDTTQLTEKENKYGWSRIKVMRNSREANSTHCMACHQGYQFAIPFNVEVNIPTVTAEYLTTKKIPVPTLGDDFFVRMDYEPRWYVQFIEKNYGPNGETNYIPKSERHKYWSTVRESKLAAKRAFMDRFNFWPTDKKLKQYFEAGMFNNTRVPDPVQE